MPFRYKQGLKAQHILSPFLARLKPCPCYRTFREGAFRGWKANLHEEWNFAGAKAHVFLLAFSARLKPCPDTKRSS